MIVVITTRFIHLPVQTTVGSFAILLSSPAYPVFSFKNIFGNSK
jgi:hypothetical protein